MYTKSGGFLSLLPHTDGVAQVDTDIDKYISAENMKHKFFSKNHIVSNECDIEKGLYNIDSGTIEVAT